jgi:hypothetical protein
MTVISLTTGGNMEIPCCEKQKNILQTSDNSRLKTRLDLRPQGGYDRKSGIVRMLWK